MKHTPQLPLISPINHEAFAGTEREPVEVIGGYLERVAEANGKSCLRALHQDDHLLFAGMDRTPTTYIADKCSQYARQANSDNLYNLTHRKFTVVSWMMEAAVIGDAVDSSQLGAVIQHGLEVTKQIDTTGRRLGSDRKRHLVDVAFRLFQIEKPVQAARAGIMLDELPMTLRGLRRRQLPIA